MVGPKPAKPLNQTLSPKPLTSQTWGNSFRFKIYKLRVFSLQGCRSGDLGFGISLEKCRVAVVGTLHGSCMAPESCGYPFWTPFCRRSAIFTKLQN